MDSASSLNAILTAGVFVFAHMLGRAALGRSVPRGLRHSALARHALGLILGVSLLTPAFSVLAVAGLYRPAWLGALGWAGAAGLMVASLRRGTDAQAPKGRIDVADTIVLISAALFVVVAASGRDETLGAGRDQQVYAEAAIALSLRGSATSTYGAIDEADSDLLRNVTGVDIPDVVRKHFGAADRIKLGHPLAWPAWLALAHSMLGVEGIYAANSVVFALGGILFFLLLRLVVSPPIAVATTMLLLALPSSLWIGGICLSEALAMALLLAVPVLGSSGAKRSFSGDCRSFDSGRVDSHRCRTCSAGNDSGRLPRRKHAD